MNNSVCFTGHRLIETRQVPVLQTALEMEIEALYQQGYETFYSGGAIGFDLYAAAMVLRVRRRHPSVRLSLVLPCPEQASRWKKEWRTLYHAVLENADEVITLQKPGFAVSRETFLQRDRYMVEHSALCVAYLVRPSGGTFYTVSYAKKRGLPVINLADVLNRRADLSQTDATE